MACTGRFPARSGSLVVMARPSGRASTRARAPIAARAGIGGTPFQYTHYPLHHHPTTYSNTYMEVEHAEETDDHRRCRGYNGLHSIIGRRRIRRVLNDLARPHVVGQDLSAGYAAMAADEAREMEAAAWSEALLHRRGGRTEA